MSNIDGNLDMLLKLKSGKKGNSIGEDVVESYTEYMTIKNGFLDMIAGDKHYDFVNRAAVESTHIFMCDYVKIDKHESELFAVIDGKNYDVKYIDDPMNLHEHLEIYLEYKQ